MSKNCVCSRVRLGLVFALGLALVPLQAFGVTITGIGVNEATSAELGGPIPGAAGCIQLDPSSTSCSDSKTNVGSAPLTVPTYSGIDSTVSTSAGSDSSVEAKGNARVELDEPFQGESVAFPGVVVNGELWNLAWLLDSDSSSFHTSAAASVSADDFVEFAVPLLAPGERFLMNVGLTLSRADFTTQFSGRLKVEDATTGTQLASFDKSGIGLTLLDLSALAGHDVRVSIVADIAMSAPEGFGGGVDPLGQRNFLSAVQGDFILREVPEPGTGMLLVIGLSALAVARRWRA